MATPVGPGVRRIFNAPTPGQIARAQRLLVPPPNVFDPLDQPGYMIFDSPVPEEEVRRFRQVTAEIEEEERQRQIRFDIADQHVEEYGFSRHPSRTVGYDDSRYVLKDWYNTEREEARRESQRKKEKKATKALIKHRSVLKQMNLTRVSGSVSQVAAQRAKEQVMLEGIREQARLATEATERAKAEEEAEFRRRFQTVKPRTDFSDDVVYPVRPRRKTFQTVQFNAPAPKRVQIFVPDEDVEMFDILNDLQQQ